MRKVAKVAPLASEGREGGPTAFSRLNGIMKGKIKIHGDIMSTGEKWDAVEGRCDNLSDRGPS